MFDDFCRLDPRLVIARRELLGLSREKTILLALAIQLFIAAFSSFLVVGLTSLYDPGSVQAGQIEVGITGEDQSALLDAVREEPGVSSTTFPERNAAREAFSEGRVDAVLNGNSASATAGGGSILHVSVTVPDGSIRTTVVVVQVRQVMKTLERQERFDRRTHLDAPPLPLPPEANASPYFGFTYTVLIPLLLFLPAFISGSVVVDSITEEIERGTFELLCVAPVSLVDIVDGKSLAMVGLAPVQAILWLVLLRANGIAISNPVSLIALVLGVTALVVTIGVALSLSVSRRRSAQLLYSVCTLVAFGAAVLLPEHPATTAAKLAIDSPTMVTYGHVVGYLAVAGLLYVMLRHSAARIEPESLS